MVIFSKLGDKGRRVKQLIVTRAMLGEIFKFDGSHIPVFYGVPSDAKIVGMDIDQSFPALVLYYEHPSFPIVSDGNLVTQTITVQNGTVRTCFECAIHVNDLRRIFNGEEF
ncbi:hypothetical protein LCGC14_1798550 [marine sediment metagenome]|uniref:Uncharacterized protein n=1 Tax=marine sediment metagenome TaxID=412755 RepID=A0A0F9J535_9ZZZZ